MEYQGDESDSRKELNNWLKCTEGELTEVERAEYEGYIRANDFIATLQAKARKMLAER